MTLNLIILILVWTISSLTLFINFRTAKQQRKQYKHILFLKNLIDSGNKNLKEKLWQAEAWELLEQIIKQGLSKSIHEESTVFSICVKKIMDGIKEDVRR